MRYLIQLILILAALASLSFAQVKSASEIRQIDVYTKTINAFTKRNRNPHVVFADVSDFDQKPKWRRFRSVRELEKFRETREVYDVANVLRKDGRIVLSMITLSSPSGDWAKYLNLYFRADGTLAKSESELRTFHGNFIALQNFYFDRRGKLLKKTLKYFDLTTKKPANPEESDVRDNSSFMTTVNYYKRTNQLPFARLLGLNPK